MTRTVALLFAALAFTGSAGLTQTLTKRPAVPTHLAAIGRVIYTAPLATWPQARTPQGSAGPEGAFYALEAVSNTWVDPGRLIPIETLPRDFVLDISFQVVYRQDCSLNIKLSDAGRDVGQVDFFLDLWASGSPTFSLYENRMQDGFTVTITRRVAERMALDPSLSTVNWAEPNTLSIRRSGSTLSFLVNGTLVSSFDVSPFDVRQLGVGLSFRSKVLLRSIVARQPA